jgi:hypothetical protein
LHRRPTSTATSIAAKRQLNSFRELGINGMLMSLKVNNNKEESKAEAEEGAHLFGYC